MQIRPFSSPDLPATLSLLAAALTADPIPEPRFTRQVLLDPNFLPEGCPVAVVNHQLVGFALSIARQTPLENAPPDFDRGHLTLLAVHPDHQRQGIGTALLHHCESFLKSQARKLVMVSPYAPHYFTPGVDVAAYPGALPFFARHGYQEVLRPVAMAAPLWSLAIPPWVHQKEQAAAARGLVIEPYRAELTLPLLAFLKKEFPGDWVRVARATIDRILAGDPPTRLFVCHDGNGAVFGFSHHDAERFGPIGTSPSHRGQGLGQILLYRTLHAQRVSGFRTAWFLWSDDKTAERIYSAAGFREVRRFALLKKAL